MSDDRQMQRLRRRIAQLELGQDTDVSGLVPFGELIKAHLAAAGMSLARAAELWGKSIAEIRALVAGRTLPDAQACERWANVLDWPTEALRRRVDAEARARAEAA